MFRISIMSTLTAIFWLTLACDYIAAQLESRTWTSRDGQQIEATFSAYDPKSRLVTLMLHDDSTLTVELTQLSQTDRRHVLLVARKDNSDDKTVDKKFEDKKQNRGERRRHRRVRDNNTTQKNEISYNRFGIDWTQGIEKALRSAEGRQGSNDDRPVMWMRVLGDLNGFM